jgi:hypothetical protein
MSKLRRLGKPAMEHAIVATEDCLAAIGVLRPSALLLLGHMRSGSTLLLHLLMTNPEISAVGERGVVYASRADLARLALATRAMQLAPFRRLRYVADQVNHNHLTPSSSLLQHPRVRVLFLLRRPEDTVASIVQLYRVHYEQPWSTSRAVAYYVERMAALAKLGESLADVERAALIRYETLTQSPQPTLEALRLFLGLQQGFSQTYETHSFTGSHGDPGPHIAAGRILTHRQPEPHVDLSQAQLQQITEAYVRCNEALARFA